MILVGARGVCPALVTGFRSGGMKGFTFVVLVTTVVDGVVVRGCSPLDAIRGG